MCESSDCRLQHVRGRRGVCCHFEALFSPSFRLYNADTSTLRLHIIRIRSSYNPLCQYSSDRLFIGRNCWLVYPVICWLYGKTRLLLFRSRNPAPMVVALVEMEVIDLSSAAFFPSDGSDAIDLISGMSSRWYCPSNSLWWYLPGVTIMCCELIDEPGECVM